MKKKTLAVLSFVSDLLIFVLTVYSVSRFFFASGEGNMNVTGAICFRYFTIDSNTLAALTCLLLLPYEFRRALGRDERMPPALGVLKLAGTAGVTITFLVVIVYLAPALGFESMFGGSNLYLHGICPVLAVLSFIFFDGGSPLSRKQCLPALLPLIIYAIVYTVMVVFITKSRGGWEDFYGLNIGGYWPVSMCILLLLNAAVVSFLRKTRNRFVTHQKNSHTSV